MDDRTPLEELDVIGPDTYAANGYPHAAWRRLREESPVHWFDLPDGVGFWALTKRSDIVEVSKQPALYRNGPRLAIFEGGRPPEGERTFEQESPLAPSHGRLARRNWTRWCSNWRGASACLTRRT